MLMQIIHTYCLVATGLVITGLHTCCDEDCKRIFQAVIRCKGLVKQAEAKPNFSNSLSIQPASPAVVKPYGFFSQSQNISPTFANRQGPGFQNNRYVQQFASQAFKFANIIAYIILIQQSRLPADVNKSNEHQMGERFPRPYSQMARVRSAPTNEQSPRPRSQMGRVRSEPSNESMGTQTTSDTNEDKLPTVNNSEIELRKKMEKISAELFKEQAAELLKEQLSKVVDELLPKRENNSEEGSTQNLLDCKGLTLSDANQVK